MKKEIVARLLKAEHITFDEALELMDKQGAVIQQPLQPYSPPINPYQGTGSPYWWQFPTITCSGLTVGENVLPLTLGNTYRADSPFNQPSSTTKDLMSYSN